MKVKAHEDLYRTLADHAFDLAASCGGHQTCGKCKVKVRQGYIEPTVREKALLTEQELEEGIRLACFHTDLQEDIEIETRSSQTMEIVGNAQKNYPIRHAQEGIGCAIDLGTTTIVMIWVDLSNGNVIKEAKFKNPQSVYGADVIARIQACQDHGVLALTDPIQKAIDRQLQETPGTLRKIFVCGNPTMEHILLGIDPFSLSQYPYTCVFEELQIVSATDLFKSAPPTCPLYILPNISAFVGGDIVADLYPFQAKKERFLLIDLGTNGEIVLSDGKTLYCTSAAAGPAFEGGQMKWGQASVAGAIHSIELDGSSVAFKTIADQEPTGICGSGYIEAFAQMRRMGKMDETGLMNEDLMITDPIVITQADLRQFQLSKSAIRSAIDLLFDTAKVGFDQVERVYISGGFSRSSHPRDLIDLKIIPEEFGEKIVLIGNSAIEGTIQAMLEEDLEKIGSIKKRSKTIELDRHPSFSQKFMENM